MLRLSKKSDYALIAMKHLATRPDCSGSSSAREISESYDIPLESVQGTRGGYRLGRVAASISVADVIQAVDGPVTVTACSADDHTCDQYTKCSIRDPLWKIKNRILDALNTVSVAEMAVESTEPVPAPSTVSRMMFVPSIGE